MKSGLYDTSRLREAENACHQAILGQTLTSDTSANGGSLAQAEVHMGVQKSVVMKRAEYVARVLNRQLIPAIVRKNYGRTQGIPMPELKFAAPDDGANVQRAEYWARVLAIPGMQVAKDVVYESLRLPIPGEGEAVLSTPDTTGMQQPSMQDPFAFLKKNSESVAAANAEDDEEPEEDRPKKRRSLLNREALASTLSELFSASLLARKEAEVQAASATPQQTPMEECKSKDPPHCRVHGFPKDWKPLPYTPTISSDEARKKLEAGITVTDPLNNNVTLDGSIIEHWVEEGKSPEDINERLSYLPVIEQGIKTPAEMWEQEDGTRIYMAAYHPIQGGRVYPLSFTVNKDSSKIRTYFTNQRNIELKRRGKKLYPPEEKSDSEPDA